MWPNVLVVANTDLMYLSATVNTINKSTPKKRKRSNICHKNIEELCNFRQHKEKKEEAWVSIKALTAPCQGDRSCSLKNYF